MPLSWPPTPRQKEGGKTQKVAVGHGTDAAYDLFSNSPRFHNFSDMRIQNNFLLPDHGREQSVFIPLNRTIQKFAILQKSEKLKIMQRASALYQSAKTAESAQMRTFRKATILKICLPAGRAYVSSFTCHSFAILPNVA